MIAPAPLTALLRHAFDHGRVRVHAVLDGCALAQLPQRLESSGQPCSCLFSGALDPQLEQAAPWLVELAADTPFTGNLLRDCWNRHGGILLQTAADTDLYTVRHHLRRYLRVVGPGGQPMLFRFYDPRAFRIAVPQLRRADYQAFLGPLQGVLIEADDPLSALRFTADGPMQGSVLALSGGDREEARHA